MEHECGNCAWAKEVRNAVSIGNAVYIAGSGSFLVCAAKDIARLDLRGDRMSCSSFKPKEGRA